MRILTLLSALATVLVLSACAGMSDAERRTVKGGALGAASGAVIGSFSGNAGQGALIGAGIGAAGGYLFDQHKKSEEEAYQRGYNDGRSR